MGCAQERGCEGREEEERTQVTRIHEVSPPCHVHPLMVKGHTKWW
jgi:hypothetical protein